MSARKVGFDTKAASADASQKSRHAIANRAVSGIAAVLMSIPTAYGMGYDTGTEDLDDDDDMLGMGIRSQSTSFEFSLFTSNRVL
jgi:hypothetical protein